MSSHAFLFCGKMVDLDRCEPDELRSVPPQSDGVPFLYLRALLPPEENYPVLPVCDGDARSAVKVLQFWR